MITIEEIKLLAELAKLEFSKEEINVLKNDLNTQLKSITNEQIIEFSWTASQLARVDGVRFEPSFKGATSYDQLCKKTRTNYFDFETKKQILLGYFFALEKNYEKFLATAWNKSFAEASTLLNLRDDTVQQSMDINTILKQAPITSNGHFVVPQVVEQ